jgi:L-2-hydroxycarboxylate dehydrogenase (NAD+)
VRNSRHYGMAGYYSQMALAQDMLGISMTNAPPLVVPTWGRERRLGTNPMSFAVPAGKEPSFLLDMATSTVPLGKIMLAQRVGADLPLGWAADRQGLPTRDASEAFQALNLLPLGGTYEQGSHKGYGLGVLVDLLCGVLSGAGGGVDLGQYTPVGHFFGAIRIDAFRPVEDFKEMMDHYLRRLRATATADGEERVEYAGLSEHERKQDRLSNGIPLHQVVVAYLRGLAQDLNVEADI